MFAFKEDDKKKRRRLKELKGSALKASKKTPNRDNVRLHHKQQQKIEFSRSVLRPCQNDKYKYKVWCVYGGRYTVYPFVDLPVNIIHNLLFTFFLHKKANK